MLTDPAEDYARGWVPFLDTKIYLDSHPLIPRTETEYWVEIAIQEIKKKQEHTSIYQNTGKDVAVKVLDLFAGSGAVGVAVLKHVPDSWVDFGEIDTAHFPTIRKNILENGIDAGRTALMETDVWSEIVGTYDVILANPPYISKEEKNNVAMSVLLHEPSTALFAEDNGFAYIEATILGLRTHLKKGGFLYIEHDPAQTKAIELLGKKCGCTAESRRDQYAKYRFSRLSAMA